ncbi:hypothetical protein D3C80_1673280 [compost metagenome]
MDTKKDQIRSLARRALKVSAIAAPGRKPPAASICCSISASQCSSVNSSRSPASAKSCWAAKKVAEATRVSLLAAMWARAEPSRVPPMQ